jgi:hypothetical protein
MSRYSIAEVLANHEILKRQLEESYQEYQKVIDRPAIVAMTIQCQTLSEALKNAKQALEIAEQTHGKDSEPALEAKANQQELEEKLTHHTGKQYDAINEAQAEIVTQTVSHFLSQLQREKAFALHELIYLINLLMSVGPEPQYGDIDLLSDIEPALHNRMNFYQKFSVEVTNTALYQLIAKLEDAEQWEEKLTLLTQPDEPHLLLLQSQVTAAINEVNGIIASHTHDHKTRQALRSYKCALFDVSRATTIIERTNQLTAAAKCLGKIPKQRIKSRLLRTLARICQTLVIPYALYRVKRWRQTGRFLGGCFRVDNPSLKHSSKAKRAAALKADLIEKEAGITKPARKNLSHALSGYAHQKEAASKEKPSRLSP